MIDMRTLRSLNIGQVTDDSAAINTASRDASLFQVKPAAIVSPLTNSHISNLVNYVNDHPEESLSLTARAAGTDMSGGPLTQSIVVDMAAHFTKIISVGDHTATVQPGVFFRDFDQATRAKNLILPCYPASRELCTVGGMVANNAGGEKTLTYGKTEDFVQELHMILADGKEHIVKPLTLSELNAKMNQQDFEGNLYRQLVDLIDKHEDIITKAKPQVSKNSTGYNLWDVFNAKHQTFDLTKLIVGAQGTLGINTQIKFRLITPNPHTQMLVIFLHNTNNLAHIVNEVLKYKPESFESYDDQTLKVALQFFPQMVKQMGTNLISLALQFLPEVGMILTGGSPKLILMAEFTGHDQAEILGRAQAAQAALKKFHLTTRLTTSEAETKKYWTIRRESFSLLRHAIKNKHTAPFIDDLTVQPQYLPEFLPKLSEIMSHYNIMYTVAGHVGDGNFHIIPLMDLSQPDQRAIIPELAEKVYDLVFQYHGSMSGEHNDGLIRGHYLTKMYGPEVYNLFVQVKNIFDPKNIFNPGKKVNSDWQFALDHMIKE